MLAPWEGERAGPFRGRKGGGSEWISFDGEMHGNMINDTHHALMASVAYHITGPMDPYGSIPRPASPAPLEGPAPECSATGDSGEASVTAFLDCAMASSGVTVVVASVQEHSA